MTRWIAPIVLAMGTCLALIGFWWLWTGLDIVQVERGWSAVIAGATMLSAGLVIMVLSAVLHRLGEIASALAPCRPRAPRAQALPSRGRLWPSQPFPRRCHHQVPKQRTKHERHVVGRHVAGESTYVMFSDGTVDAQTPDGVLHFSSLDELRVYADEREAAERS